MMQSSSKRRLSLEHHELTNPYAKLNLRVHLFEVTFMTKSRYRELINYMPNVPMFYATISDIMHCALMLS